MELGHALDDLVRRSGAIGAAVWSSVDDAGAVMLAAAPASLMANGASWHLGEMPPDAPDIVRDPARFARVLPTAMRLALPATPEAVVTSSLGDELVLVAACGDRRSCDRLVSALGGEEGAGLARAAERHARWQAMEVRAARADALLGALVQAVVIVDDVRAVAEVNAPAARLLGIPAGTVGAATVAAAMRRLQSTVVNRDAVDQVGAALMGDPAAVVEGVVWERHGEPGFLRVSSTAVAGAPHVGRVWVFDDVSVEVRAAREAEAALERAHESEERFRLLAENAYDVVMSGTNEGIVTWISPSITPLAGWETDEVTGRPFADFVHPDDVPTLRAHQAALLEGHPAVFETRLRRKDGDWRWGRVQVRPLLDDSGAVIGRVGNWRDIEPEREQWELFGRAIDALPDVAVLIVDTDLRFRIVRGGALSGDDEGSSAWEGRSLDEALSQPARAFWRPLYVAALSGRESLVENQTDAGRTFRTSVRPLMGPDATIYGAAALAMDITDRAELDRLKDRMIATVSHELRTPVTSLSLLLEVLTEEDELSADTRRLVEVGERSAVRLRRLVEDLLLLAEAHHEGVRLMFEPMNPHEIVTDAVAELESLAHDKDVALAVTAAPIDSAVGDPVRVCQVVVNLVGNAVKFTPEGGDVDVRVQPDGEEWVLEVHDSGIGVPANEVDNLFDPFFRASTATDAVIGGTGLGLSVVRHLVDAHGGRLSVVSDVGRGTTVTVRFPLDPAGGRS